MEKRGFTQADGGFMRPSALILAGSFCLALTSTAVWAAKVVPFTSYVPQTPRVSMSCFPKPLQTVLDDLGRQFGRQVVVTSGHRTTRSTRKGSQHRTCKAADIRIAGVSPGTIARVARKNPMVGGVGTYCGRSAGIVHVDVGPPRSWHYCGRKGRKKRR
jgi:uncharacterized protein YcbK (DUF882 family)